MLSGHLYASQHESYMERFNAYQAWNEQLPINPDDNFLTFIDSNTPLANKLRAKWLYHLGRQKDWDTFNQHYKPSNDIGLQCFAALAEYYQGKTDNTLSMAKSLWLSGNERPDSCSPLFALLLNSDNFNEHLISQRIILALDKNNVSLARYLLKQYQVPRFKDEQLLTLISQHPERIISLDKGPLHDVFYLYGLKRMIANHIDKATAYWKSAKTSQMLNPAQQQSFFAHLALYQAIRNPKEADKWFKQVKPGFYNDALLDWQIRLALKQKKWDDVSQLIGHVKDKNNLCWQYWQARALEQTGHLNEARERYQTLSLIRHYYGFLASLRLNKPFSFQSEPVNNHRSYLKPYKAFTSHIQQLYETHQTLQASRLLNDFMLELPKDDKSALINWVSENLQWYSKSVDLSNNKSMINQLSLRFPLPFKQVPDLAQNNRLPPALIYAIIRQESGFRDDVVSPAGARGLMQIMPATASLVAKQQKINYNDKNQLFKPQKNIAIGIAYLGQLAAHFTRRPVLMAAAYNAGPRQVNYWLKNHPPKEMDIWIDTLPWRETRNYLKNVISFYVVYQYRLHNKSDLQAVMRALS